MSTGCELLSQEGFGCSEWVTHFASPGWLLNASGHSLITCWTWWIWTRERGSSSFLPPGLLLATSIPCHRLLPHIVIPKPGGDWHGIAWSFDQVTWFHNEWIIHTWLPQKGLASTWVTYSQYLIAGAALFCPGSNSQPHLWVIILSLQGTMGFIQLLLSQRSGSFHRPSIRRCIGKGFLHLWVVVPSFSWSHQGDSTGVFQTTTWKVNNQWKPGASPWLQTGWRESTRANERIFSSGKFLYYPFQDPVKAFY